MTRAWYVVPAKVPDPLTHSYCAQAALLLNSLCHPGRAEPFRSSRTPPWVESKEPRTLCGRAVPRRRRLRAFARRLHKVDGDEREARLARSIRVLRPCGGVRPKA